MSEDDDDLATNAALAAIVASNTADERALARRLLPRVLAQAISNGHALHGDGDTVEWAGTVLLVAMTTTPSDRIALFDQVFRAITVSDGSILDAREHFVLAFWPAIDDSERSAARRAADAAMRLAAELDAARTSSRVDCFLASGVVVCQLAMGRPCFTGRPIVVALQWLDAQLAAMRSAAANASSASATTALPKSCVLVAESAQRLLGPSASVSPSLSPRHSIAVPLLEPFVIITGLSFSASPTRLVLSNSSSPTRRSMSGSGVEDDADTATLIGRLLLSLTAPLRQFWRIGTERLMRDGESRLATFVALHVRSFHLWDDQVPEPMRSLFTDCLRALRPLAAEHRAILHDVIADTSGVTITFAFGLLNASATGIDVIGLRACVLAGAALLELQRTLAGPSPRLQFNVGCGVATSRVLLRCVGNDDRRVFVVDSWDAETPSALVTSAQIAAQASEQDGNERGLILCDRATSELVESVRFPHLSVLLTPASADLFGVELFHATSEYRAPPLIGRARELSAVKSALDVACLAGTSAAICVEGEMGIGKSALLYHVMHTMNRTDMGVCLSRCAERTSTQPYAVWRPVLHSLFGTDKREVLLPRFSRVLEPFPHLLAVLPLLEFVLPLGLAPTAHTTRLDPRSRNAMLRECLQHLIVDECHRPMLLMFDDAQWMDTFSWDLLQLCVAMVSNPVVFLLTFRCAANASSDSPDLPSDEARDRSDLARLTDRLDALRVACQNNVHAEIDFRHVVLRPLTRDNVGELLAQRLRLPLQGNAPALRTVASFLHTLTGGNVFLAEEMTKYLCEKGVLAVDASPSDDDDVVVASSAPTTAVAAAHGDGPLKAALVKSQSDGHAPASTTAAPGGASAVSEVHARTLTTLRALSTEGVPSATSRASPPVPEKRLSLSTSTSPNLSIESGSLPHVPPLSLSGRMSSIHSSSPSFSSHDSSDELALSSRQHYMPRGSVGSGGELTPTAFAARRLVVRHLNNGEINLPLSVTIEAAMRSRIEKLTSGQVELLNFASVLGSQFPVAALLATASSTARRQQLLKETALLVDDGLFRVASEVSHTLRLRFHHQLMQETLYSLLAPQQRRTMHLTVAQWYERHRTDELALTAFHFERAGQPARAIAYRLAAANFAADHGAVRESIEHHSQLIALSEVVNVPPQLKAEWYFEIGAAGYAEGRLVPAHENLIKALRLLDLPPPSPSLSTVTNLASTAFKTWWNASHTAPPRKPDADHEMSIDEIARAHGINGAPMSTSPSPVPPAAPEPPSSLRDRLASLESSIGEIAPPPSPLVVSLELVTPLALLQSRIYSMLALVVVLRGDSKASFDAAMRSLRFAEQYASQDGGDTPSIERAVAASATSLGLLHMSGRLFSIAQELAGKAQHDVELLHNDGMQFGRHLSTLMALRNISFVLFLRGNLTDALSGALNAVNTCRTMHDGFKTEALLLALAGLCCLHSGTFASGSDLMLAPLQPSSKPVVPQIITLYLSRASIASDVGDAPALLGILRKAKQLLQSDDVPPTLLVWYQALVLHLRVLEWQFAPLNGDAAAAAAVAPAPAAAPASPSSDDNDDSDGDASAESETSASLLLPSPPGTPPIPSEASQKVLVGTVTVADLLMLLLGLPCVISGFLPHATQVLPLVARLACTLLESLPSDSNVREEVLHCAQQACGALGSVASFVPLLAASWNLWQGALDCQRSSGGRKQAVKHWLTGIAAADRYGQRYVKALLVAYLARYPTIANQAELHARAANMLFVELGVAATHMAAAGRLPPPTNPWF